MLALQCRASCAHSVARCPSRRPHLAVTRTASVLQQALAAALPVPHSCLRTGHDEARPRSRSPDWLSAPHPAPSRAPPRTNATAAAAAAAAAAERVPASRVAKIPKTLTLARLSAPASLTARRRRFVHRSAVFSTCGGACGEQQRFQPGGREIRRGAFISSPFLFPWNSVSAGCKTIKIKKNL